MDAARPLPLPDEQTRGFWDGCRAHELRLLRCAGCATWIHEPAAACHACHSLELRWTRASGRGRVYSWTVVHHAPAPGFRDETPYVVAWIELDEQRGLRLLSNLVGIEPARIAAGMRVEVEFLDVAPDVSLPVFRPAGAD